MNIIIELCILGVVFIIVVLFALWRGNQVETGFRFFRVHLFLRYRRDSQK